MLQAIIRYKGNTLLIDIPYKRYDICGYLGSIGISNIAGDIYICDNEDEAISVKLYSINNFGRRLLPLFNENTTLSTVNTVCDLLRGLPEEQADEINYYLAHGEYDTLPDLLTAVKNLNAPHEADNSCGMSMEDI